MSTFTVSKLIPKLELREIKDSRNIFTHKKQVRSRKNKLVFPARMVI